ncbi:MAG: hypothetical protein ACYC64_07575 [Armatimonadota bacterium]
MIIDANKDDCTFLMPANWTTAMKNTVKTDLDILSSQGAEVIRFNLGSGMGWNLTAGGGPGGSQFTADFTSTVANWTEFLGFVNERGLKIIPLLANYFDVVGPSPGVYWWQTFYPNTDAGFSNFLLDTAYYYNAFISAVNNNYPSMMPYVDMVGEYNTVPPRMGWYVRYMYDWSTIPAGKKGCSILSIPADSNSLYTELGGRTLNYTAFSCYPGLNETVSTAYNALRTRFPAAEVGMNEAGYDCPNSSYEAAQQSWVVSKFTDAANLNIPYRMHWSLWDTSTNPYNDMGWGYTQNSLKDV